MATTKTVLLAIFALGLLACQPPEPPTHEELEFRCNTGCGHLESIGCPSENCYDACLGTVADAEREGCTIEAEEIMDCAEAQPDEVRCDQDRTNAACIDEVNAFLNCQSAE